MIIVGDVHGQMLMLEKLLESFDAGTEVCFVGDLVDRGPRSREVVKFVRDHGHSTVLGNHEDMMVTCLMPLIRGEGLGHDFPHDVNNWIRNGGAPTLASYGVVYNGIASLSSSGLVLPQDLVDDVLWMASLPHYLVFEGETDDMGRTLVVSHSGALSVWSGRDTDAGKGAILWDRDMAFSAQPGTEKLYNVFGHTPMGAPYIMPHLSCIDTGAFHHSGSLTAMEYPSRATVSVGHLLVHPEDAPTANH